MPSRTRSPSSYANDTSCSSIVRGAAGSGRASAASRRSGSACRIASTRSRFGITLLIDAYTVTRFNVGAYTAIKAISKPSNDCHSSTPRPTSRPPTISTVTRPTPATASRLKRASNPLRASRTRLRYRFSPTVRACSSTARSPRFTLMTLIPDETWRKLSYNFSVASRARRAAAVIRRPSEYTGTTPSGAPTNPISASLGLRSHATTASPARREMDSTIVPTCSVTLRIPWRSVYDAMTRSPWLLRSKKRTDRVSNLASTCCIESISTRRARRTDSSSPANVPNARSSQMPNTSDAPSVRAASDTPPLLNARSTSRSAQTMSPCKTP